MYEKIVRRVPVAVDPVSDLIGVIDLIEFELFCAGNRTARDCLAEVVEEIRRTEGSPGENTLGAILDVIERLEKIGRVLSDSGFERPARG